MPRRSLLLALALAAATWAGFASGCSGGDRAWFLPLPPHPGARAMIAAVERSDAVILRAVNLDAPSALRLSAADLGSDAAVRIELLFFPQPLADLQIAEGSVALADPGSEGARPLPTAHPMFAATLDLEADLPPAWTAAAELDLPLRDLRLPALASPCSRFVTELHTLETAEQGSFLVALSETTALAGTYDGRLFVIDATGGHREVSIAQGAEDPVSAALRDPSGQLWLGRVSGALDRVSFDGERFERLGHAALPAEGALHWLEGQSSTSAPDLLGLSTEGILSRWTGGEARQLHHFPRPSSSVVGTGAIARVRPGELVAALAAAYVVRVREGEVTIERPPVVGGVNYVAEVPGLGTVVGSSEGEFALHDGTAWARLEGSPLHVWNTALAVYEDGFVYSGSFDNFGEYKIGWGFCSLEMPVGFDIRYFAALGADLVLFGENPTTPATPYAILRRQH